MKKLLYLFFALAAVFAAVSCESDIEPKKPEPVVYLKDGDVITYMKSTKPQEVPLIFMGDGFTAKYMSTNGDYMRILSNMVDELFKAEPFKTYKEYFSVYFVVAVSSDEGVGTLDNPVNNALGTCFVPRYGVPMPEINTDRVEEYARRVSTDSEIGSWVVIVNCEKENRNGKVDGVSSGGGAIVLRYNDDFDHATLTIIHEIGHSFGYLADEYTAYPGQEPYIYTPEDNEYLESLHLAGEYLNVSATDDPTKVPWAHFIGHPNYPYVGVYEGAQYAAQGIWRSEEFSCLSNGLQRPYFNAISREAIVRRIFKIAGEEYSFENFVEKDIYVDYYE